MQALLSTHDAENALPCHTMKQSANKNYKFKICQYSEYGNSLVKVLAPRPYQTLMTSYTGVLQILLFLSQKYQCTISF